MDNKVKEKLKENIDIAINGGATLIGSMLSDALIGQVAPCIATTVLNYKQKRTEKMLLTAIEQLREHIDKIELKLKEMSETEVDFIRNKAIPIVFENIERESQEEKIKFIINGIRNIINNKITDEDLILTYYDILNRLRIIDIKILINIYKESKKMVAVYEIDKSNGPMDLYEAVETHLIRKLENLCLVTVTKTFGDIGGNFSKITPDRVKTSVLGANVIEFFNMHTYKY
ncbi:hypothetical protein [Clostridium tetani]|nr:hypothetical protein [Clostridium tetani]